MLRATGLIEEKIHLIVLFSNVLQTKYVFDSFLLNQNPNDIVKKIY